MNKKGLIIPLVLIFVVSLIAWVFHYPVHIENALTFQPEPGFGLLPSGWRLVFEPFLGILLYFNRAFYAIEELIFVLCWMIVFFIAYSIIKSFRMNNRQLIKRFLLSQLLNLPILLGVWITLFVVILFIPLPNDRIVNKTTDKVLVTTHSHTVYSHDGLISQDGLLKWHQQNGFDAFFITDHSNHKQTLDFVNSRMGKELPGEPFVFCGEEFSGSNHLSLLGLKTDFSTKNQPDSAVVAKARADGAAIIVNHWFDGEHKTLEYYKKLGVDGFEIENVATDKRYSRGVYNRIRTFCETNRLIMNGGLDFHGYGSTCTLWNAFQIPGWKNLDYRGKEEAILTIIKTHDQAKLSVLLLNDRPYYDKKHLIFSPFVTLFNYFRTLNSLQVLSWACWILLVALLYQKMVSSPNRKQNITGQRFLPLLGILAALFLSGLGLVYFSLNQHVAGFTKMYPVYGRLLLTSGLSLLIFSAFMAWFRIFKQRKN